MRKRELVQLLEELLDGKREIAERAREACWRNEGAVNAIAAILELVNAPPEK